MEKGVVPERHGLRRFPSAVSSLLKSRRIGGDYPLEAGRARRLLAGRGGQSEVAGESGGGRAVEAGVDGRVGGQGGGAGGAGGAGRR